MNILVILFFIVSCAHEREGRAMADISGKVEKVEFQDISFSLNCTQMKKELEGRAIKRCLKKDLYAFAIEEQISCPTSLFDPLVYPESLKFKCFKSYEEATSKFPKKVIFRSKTETFNTVNQFVLRDGIIWFKKINSRGKWKVLPLPHDINVPVEIGSDSEHFVAIDQKGRVFTIQRAGKRNKIKSDDWSSTWGTPFWFGPGINLPKRKAWEISFFSPSDEKFYIDPAGNKHGIGVGVTTLYVLNDDKQRITYLDPWLPADYSYEVCGPHRGLFKAQNLSASGSTIFLINEYGDMFTRMYDFDISGGNNVLMKYTYDKAKSTSVVKKGEMPEFYQPLFDFRALAASSWDQQPKIAGKITDRISISKGVGHIKYLRVEGENKKGEIGYFEKKLKDKVWAFKKTGSSLKGNILSNSLIDNSKKDLGKDESMKLISSNKTMEIKNFHLYCSPADLVVKFKDGEVLKLKLHTRETLRQKPLKRGLDIDPVPLSGAIEIPAITLKTLSSRSKQIKDFITKNLAGKRFTTIQAVATYNLLMIYGKTGESNNLVDSVFSNSLSGINSLIFMSDPYQALAQDSTFTWEFRISRF